MTISTPHPPDANPPTAPAGGEGESEAGRRRATFTAVALVLALAGLVAVASQGTPVWTPPREGRADRSAILAGIAVLWGMGIVAASVVTVLVHRAVIARRPGAPPLRTTLLRALPITAVALAAASLLAIARLDLGPGAEPGDGVRRTLEESGRPGKVLEIIGWWNTAVRAGEGEAEPDEPGEAGPEDDGLPYLLIVGVVATAIVGAAAWRWHASRSALPEPLHDDDDDESADDPGREAVHGAVIGTIDAMLADPDPNTAIIGAYARLLEGLAACGTGRRDHEGPMEHLRRVLTVLRVRPEPLRRLIELFEIARFSTQPLSTSHREQALDALRAVATDLDAASASPAGTAGSRPLGARP